MTNKNVSELLQGQSYHRSSIDVNIDYMDDDILFIEDLRQLPKLYSARLDVNIICVCKQGKMEMDIGDNHYVLTKGETLVCPSGAYIGNPMVSPDFTFAVVCLTDRVVHSLLSTNVDIWNRAVYYRQEHIVQRGADTHNFGEHALAISRMLIEDKENPFREEMIRTMFQLMLLGFCARNKKIEEQELGEHPSRSPQSKVIFNKFMDLLKSESIKHQPVYYYAEKLCISAKYLSHVCKEVSGKSANEFIRNAVVEEITYYLRNTEYSVKEISVRMGFPNISFFGKYVKSYLGVSPNEYRKQIYSNKN